MIALFAVTFAVIALALVFAKRIPPRALFGLGAVLVAVGVAAIGLLEWRYSANTRPLDIPFGLARAGQVETPSFVIERDGPYDIWLQTDRTVGIPAFGCLTGEPAFEALCPGQVPVLDLAWTATTDGVPVARGGADLQGWRRRQAMLDPRDAARKFARFRAYSAKEAADPANQWPLFHRLGTFDALAGKTYRLTLDLKAPVPQLAALHPRLTVGLGGETTRGLGRTVIGYGLLCLIGGGLMLLLARSRAQARAAA
jgi:hypothetical protein